MPLLDSLHVLTHFCLVLINQLLDLLLVHLSESLNFLREPGLALIGLLLSMQLPEFLDLPEVVDLALFMYAPHFSHNHLFLRLKRHWKVFLCLGHLGSHKGDHLILFLDFQIFLAKLLLQ